METRPVWLLVTMMLAGIGLAICSIYLLSFGSSMPTDAERMALPLTVFAGAGLALLSAVLLVSDARRARSRG